MDEYEREQEENRVALERERRDRVADHTPAPAEWSGTVYVIGGQRIQTRRHRGPWQAVALGRGVWECGATEMEALGRLVVSLAACGRAEVPIVAEDFEPPLAGDELRRVEAVEAVLIRLMMHIGHTRESLRAAAGEILAAADTGI